MTPNAITAANSTYYLEASSYNHQPGTYTLHVTDNGTTAPASLMDDPSDM